MQRVVLEFLRMSLNFILFEWSSNDFLGVPGIYLDVLLFSELLRISKTESLPLEPPPSEGLNGPLDLGGQQRECAARAFSHCGTRLQYIVHADVS